MLRLHVANTAETAGIVNIFRHPCWIIAGILQGEKGCNSALRDRRKTMTKSSDLSTYLLSAVLVIGIPASIALSNFIAG